MSRFLRFVVELELRGEGERLKEYVVGVEVFDRGESFDPASDSLVRVEARRLRSKLNEYYEAEGRLDPVSIGFPKGSYIPVFEWRRPPEAVEPRPEQPKRRWALLAAGVVVAVGVTSFAALRMARKSGAPAPSAIAVLPFLDLSPQKDQEYFCDGMTEELIQALGKVPGLHVPARTSVFQFKGKADDIRRIGEKLSVETVLEGSVRKAGDQLLIAVNLVNAADGYHLWSHTYDRDVKDVFAVQEEIARAVVDALRLEVTGKLVKRPTDKLEAYTLYLFGRYFWNKMTRPGWEKSIEYFERALQEDPKFALAYTGITDAHCFLGTLGDVPIRVSLPKARSAAARALQLDPDLAEAHIAMGHVLSFERSWPEAEKAYKRGLRLNPNSPLAHVFFAGTLLLPLGRTDEALLETRRALKLDPLSLFVNRALGWTLYQLRRYDEAAQQLRKTLELDPDFATAHINLGQVFLEQRKFEEAIAEFQKAGSPAGPLALLYARSGRPEEARRMLDKLRPGTGAAVYAALGDKDQAFGCIDQGLQQGRPYIWIKTDPHYDPLRSDPRFAVLLKRLGLEK
jgi:adenylate cyclase